MSGTDTPTIANKIVLLGSAQFIGDIKLEQQPDGSYLGKGQKYFDGRRTEPVTLKYDSQGHLLEYQDVKPEPLSSVFYDVDGLVKKLNEIPDSQDGISSRYFRGDEQEFELGAFRDTTPQGIRALFVDAVNKLCSRKMVARGRYPLFQTGYEPFGIIESRQRVGHISLETGYPNTSFYENKYEDLEFILKQPVLLRSGAEIPACCVMLSAEGADHEKPVVVRTNKASPEYLQHIEQLLPTEWFLK